MFQDLKFHPYLFCCTVEFQGTCKIGLLHVAFITHGIFFEGGGGGVVSVGLQYHIFGLLLL